MPEMIVNFFTAEDFVRPAQPPGHAAPDRLLHAVRLRRADLTGGKESAVGKLLVSLSDVMLKFVQIITYYAPIAFFGFFADLVATYGAEVIKGYGRAMAGLLSPVLSSTSSPPSPCSPGLAAARAPSSVMFKHLARPAVVSLGTCSSVATIPTNLEEAAETGIDKDVSRHGAAPGRNHAHGRLLL